MSLEHAVVASEFGNLEIIMRDSKLDSLDFSPKEPSPAKHSAKLSEVIRQLHSYFAGIQDFGQIDMELAGTEFQVAVWTEIKKIPAGQTVSYGDIAKAVGRPKAFRAVGAAVGANPIAIIVGCHRVLGANGQLTGYTGGSGLETKKRLLNHERLHFGA